MTENIDVAAVAAPVPNQDDVELTIRQAYQAENDFVFSCPTDWSVKQIKEHIKNCIDKRPAVSTQRLIFSGASLTDEQILSNILKERSHVAGEQIFFHLVIAQPYQATPAPAEVRRRNVNIAGSSRPDLSAGPTAQVIGTEAYQQNMAGWQQYWTAFHQLPPEAQVEEHQRLVTHYCSYVMSTAGAVPQVQTPIVNNPQQNAALWRARVQGQAAAPAANGNAANQNGNNNPGRVDILEVGYRIFKLVLLFSAILLYSSFERFAIVLCAALFIYFIQLRRNHVRNRAQAPPAASAAAAAQPAEPHVNNNNNGENDGENATPPADGEAPVVPEVPPQPVVEQPSGMQVFIATCYSFVTSFFASLVPDHPMPMDLN